jgi:hypothetical protein
VKLLLMMESPKSQSQMLNENGASAIAAALKVNQALTTLKLD